MSLSPLERILAALHHAEGKHPRFACTAHEAGVVIAQEAIEHSKAVLAGDRENEREELAQLAAVCWRRLEMMDCEDSNA